MPDVDNPNPFPPEEVATNIIPNIVPSARLFETIKEMTEVAKRQEGDVETYRTVHVDITFTTYGTAAQAHRAGTKAAYDVELALHRSIESKVWIEEAIL